MRAQASIMTTFVAKLNIFQWDLKGFYRKLLFFNEFSLFFRDGVAFFIDKDLNSGHSYRSETYYNQPFVGEKEDGGNFQVLSLEVYVLV